MNPALKSLLALVAAVLGIPSASAQISFGRMGSTVLGGLVENESVQKELKLSAEQIKKCKDINLKVRDKYKDEFGKIPMLKPEARGEFLRELMKTMGDDTAKELTTVLNPAQSKRLNQIDLQQRGAQAFLDAQVEKALLLTDDQKEQVKTINADALKEIQRQLSQGTAGAKIEDFGKKMLALRKETMDRLMATLTDQQKKAWEDLIGTPFELKTELPTGR